MHDASPGPLTRCQITGSENLNLVIDLGHQPLCDGLLSREDLGKEEKTYPLRLMHCPDSGLAQLDYVVDGTEVYPPTYPYRSGISKPLAEYQRAFADRVVERFGKGLAVDLGSNDGTLLTGFVRNECRVLGVEPTNVAKIAEEENDIPTRQEFFTEKIAREIVADLGRAKIVTMTNVFAHMAGLGEVMRGLVHLVGRSGVFISESHYLLDVLEKNQFDTVYHEHIRTYSLKALVKLFPQYGMEVFDVERASRYGGNIRIYASHKGAFPVSDRVGELLSHEEDVGLHLPGVWEAFRRRVLRNRDLTMEFLYQMHRGGKLVVGCSAPGRASTLINFYGISPDLVEYLGELHDSLKLGKFLPGRHLPIISNRAIVEDRPDAVILFSWHYADVISKRLRSEGVTCPLYVPLPVFQEVA